jgi:FkbM family methyltransferase
VSLRDTLIEATMRVHLDEPLQRARARLSPSGREDAEEQRQLEALLTRTLTPASNCIDIGAYRGRILKAMVARAPLGTHIAYEPLPHLHSLLVRRFPDVDVRLAAVSSASGQTTFTMVRDSPGLSGFRDRWDGGDHRTEAIPVRVEALDTDLPPGYVPHFIKIDVEGAEQQVFEGAIETIVRHKPTILFEHGKGGADHYGTEPRDIYRLLCTDGGLRLVTLDVDRPLDLRAFESEFVRNERWNFVARA